MRWRASTCAARHKPTSPVSAHAASPSGLILPCPPGRATSAYAAASQTRPPRQPPTAVGSSHGPPEANPRAYPSPLCSGGFPRSTTMPVHFTSTRARASIALGPPLQKLAAGAGRVSYAVPSINAFEQGPPRERGLITSFKGRAAKNSRRRVKVGRRRTAAVTSHLGLQCWRLGGSRGWGSGKQQSSRENR